MLAKVTYGLEHIPAGLDHCALTIGNYDGVHRGHQQIIAQAGMFAARRRGPVVVMTFDPHPLEVLAPARAPARLMPVEEKVRWLVQAGADHVIVLRTDPELLQRDPETFVEKLVVSRLKPAYMIEGWSFRFGKDRKGTPELLQKLGERFGFDVFIVEPINLQVAPGETVLVTSSLVRGLIRSGEVHRAHLCLGRPYTLVGTVIHGHDRGRSMGYPTANLGNCSQLIPAEGVYAGTADVLGKRWAAAISIGTAPTFGEGRLQVEAFLLDCDDRLYEEPIRFSFLKYLRPQETYESVAALREQIDEDVREVRRTVGEEIHECQ